MDSEPEPTVAWALYRSQGLVLFGHCLGPEPGPAQTDHDAQKNIKVAAFDLNKTLIVSKSGSLHGKESDPTDWQWLYESVPSKLHALAHKDYKVIIVSNQGRLTGFDGREAPEAVPFKRKMELVMRELQIPVTLFVACANDIYRKPRPGLWSIIPELTGNEGCRIDMVQSFVVGDAAGRKADFSDSDMHWAMNAGIKFYTPEMFFRGETPESLGHKFHPEWHLNGIECNEGGQVDVMWSLSTSMVVLVGLPGAGKTTFYHRVLRDRGFVRRDARSYSSRQTFILAVDEVVRQGIPVVIDDMNLDIESRSTWISIAAKHGITANAALFMSSTDLCLHNDTVRALGGPLVRTDYSVIVFFSHENDKL
ncbi:polynucleotide kinase 3 phosphatase domain-containing protein [Trichoderma pleuroticola]